MRRRRVLSLIAVAVAGTVVGLASARRGPTGLPLLPGPAREHALAEAKLNLVLPVVDLRGVSLEQALDALRRQAGADIVVDWDAIDGAQIRRSAPVDVRLRDVTLGAVLTAVLGYAGSGEGASVDLQYTLFRGSIVVTTTDRAARYVYAAVYDLRDIDAGPPDQWSGGPIANVCYFSASATTQSTQSDGGNSPPGGLFNSPSAPPPAPPTRAEIDDEIARLIMETIAPEIWQEAGGDGGFIRVVSGQAFVVTTWSYHRQIERLLNESRHPPTPPE